MSQAGWVKTRDPSAPFNELQNSTHETYSQQVGQYFEFIGKLYQGMNKANSTCKAE